MISSRVKLVAQSCALGLVLLPAGASAYVNDTFTNLDRIGGTDGSSTTASSPVISTPTSTNTQWVVNGTSQMVATGSGLNWNMNNTSNRMAIGYFPTVSVGSEGITLNLSFRTGAFGGTPNNLRIAILDSSPNGFRTTDGFGSTDASYVGDRGYALFSSGSFVGGGNTNNLVLNTFKRTDTNSNDLLGSAGVWGSAIGGSGSSGATGYLDANTDSYSAYLS
ncbi:MAG: hypothetical protein LR015_10220 [Verrucomicrobia bacterium]|nr:hypothetical protein [Verrucomicrobiota bacterium]